MCIAISRLSQCKVFTATIRQRWLSSWFHHSSSSPSILSIVGSAARVGRIYPIMIFVSVVCRGARRAAWQEIERSMTPEFKMAARYCVSDRRPNCQNGIDTAHR
eukprot:scaffold51832_cov57-Attheya_sp.AAC.5